REPVGLNTGTRGQLAGGLKPAGQEQATLASQGIDKNLAHQARVFGAMDDADFERKVVECTASITDEKVMSAAFRWKPAATAPHEPSLNSCPERTETAGCRHFNSDDVGA